MSINFPSADFTPQLQGYTGQGAFRFWCQKVLPLVYDDSLSYYELLNKVVVYLNNVISDVSTVETNVGELNHSYTLLQTYVNSFKHTVETTVNTFERYMNEYFDNLDVQQEINNKLDEMAGDGSLSALISPIVVEITPDVITAWLNEHITPTSPPVDNTLKISGAAADSAAVGNAFSDIIAKNYDASTGVYGIGDYCIYENKLYRCVNAIDTPETWDSSHWNVVDAGSELNKKYLHFNFVTEDNSSSLYDGKAYNLPINSFSFISPSWFDDMSNLPNIDGTIFYVAQSANVGRTQFFVAIDGRVFVRYANYQADVFNDWFATSTMENLCNEYDSNITYKRGDYCAYGGIVYLCKETTSGSFDSTKWSSTRVMTEFRGKGLRFNSVTESIAVNEYSSAASNLPFNTFSFVSPVWFTDMNGHGGISQAGTIFYVSQSASIGRTQIFVQMDGRIFVRYASVGASFGEWCGVPITSDIGVYYDVNTEYKRGDYCVYNGSVYYCVASTTGVFDSSKWSATNVMKEFRGKAFIWNVITQGRASSEYSGLASNLPFNSFSFVNSSWFTDMYNQDGVSGSGMIFYLAQTATIGRTQVFIKTTGEIFVRYASTSQNFGGWISVNNWYADKTYDKTAHYYAYGDSTTKGQIGTWGGETAGTSVYNYPRITAKRLNMVSHNLAVGGQGLCTDYDEIISDINETTFDENTKLITVGWAYNDSQTYASLPFGSANSLDEITVIGKYYNVMKLLQEKNKNALVVLVTGYGYPGGNISDHIYANLRTQFTHNYSFSDGNKSVKEFYDTLEEMCNLHGWCCINQAKGSAFNEFNADAVFGDNVHPTNNGYKIYSNFLAAKIMSVFANNKY